MIKAILFDMNGVIIDDEHIHELAFCKTVEPFGIRLTHEECQKYCAGKTDKAGYQAISEAYKTELPIDELLIKKAQYYSELFPANKKSFPGVVELIHSLSKIYMIAVTSSASRFEVDLITKEFGIHSVLKVTISGDDVSVGKPDPEPYRLTCQKLGINAQEAVVIEDSKHGVTSAKAAGCYCIGITTTHTIAELSASDMVVDDFSEISLDLLTSLGSQ